MKKKLVLFGGTGGLGEKLSKKLETNYDVLSLGSKQLDITNKLAVDKIKNDSKLNDQEKRMKIKTVIASSRELRKKIFTAEQLETLEKMQKNKKKHKENN